MLLDLTMHVFHFLCDCCHCSFKRNDIYFISISEAEVLAAPPKLVYIKLILRFARKLLVAVMDKWDSHVLVIDRVAPNWKVCTRFRGQVTFLHLHICLLFQC